MVVYGGGGRRRDGWWRRRGLLCSGSGSSSVGGAVVDENRHVVLQHHIHTRGTECYYSMHDISQVRVNLHTNRISVGNNNNVGRYLRIGDSATNADGGSYRALFFALFCLVSYQPTPQRRPPQGCRFIELVRRWPAGPDCGVQGREEGLRGDLQRLHFMTD
ncbi:hypothetical protein F5Y04DRAFT_161723 [Hypomontagnella monticulosa]|nr:hypothetical protein F5Y04DRAFT_161723 [Hypomontagnella monticulosa]